MRLKKFALRGLIFLAVAVALCMFFARTVQTITTPKVQLVTGSSGRYEEKMKFRAEVFFPEDEEIIVPEAKELGVVVKRVYVKPGHQVQAGDIIFTAEAGDSAAKMKELREQYNSKSSELLDLDVKNRKSSKESRQNDLYNAMVEAQNALTEKSMNARMAAVEAGIILVGDVAEWRKQLALVGDDVPEAVTKAVTAAETAKSACDAAKSAFDSLMEDRKMRVKDDVFEYIKNRDALLKVMDEIAQEMVELSARAKAVTEVRAPRDGYIVSLGVTEGENYDGVKAAYKMNKEGTLPILRAPVSSDDRAIADGTKAEVKNEVYGTEASSVQETVINAEGGKYLHLTMPSGYLEGNTSAIRRIMSDGGVDVTITYRARQSTTLLPPSAVRSEGQGQDYVYLVQRDWGGFMSGSSMKVVKTRVTVLERGDKVVSIAEDLSYQDVADREDRALTDGQKVMEYVN